MTNNILRSSSIQSITAFEALDSRGFPTVAATVELADGSTGSASVPAGASTGEHEAAELRDGDSGRYLGRGVLKAVANIEEEILPALAGKDGLQQASIDRLMVELDGTANKSSIGANAILAVSMATACAAAKFQGVPLFRYLGGAQARKLPVPLVNILNGGAHASNSLDFQEFMIVPHGSTTFFENLRIAAEVFHTLKKNLKAQGHLVALGDEGGFAPNLESSESAISALLTAISDAGYEPGKDVSLALDVAASEFYDPELGAYVLKKSTNERLSSDQLIELYSSWLARFPIVSIEDGLDQNDWEGWSKLTKRLGPKVQLVGDDLFCTNTSLLRTGFDSGAANAILIKLNQIGTVTETLSAISLAQDNSYRAVISHRSGETEDTFISDLAVATGAGQIKTGSVSRSERTAKYNRLLWIESYLAGEAFMDFPYTGLGES